LATSLIAFGSIITVKPLSFGSSQFQAGPASSMVMRVTGAPSSVCQVSVVIPRIAGLISGAVLGSVLLAPFTSTMT
jgi:hypothetical protein